MVAMLQPINSKFIPIAIEEVGTVDFEKFGQAFYGALAGAQFVPLGGMHDGGADGFFEPELFQDEKVHHFLQISKQITFEQKIKGTIARLRKVGRQPKSLTYLSSLQIQDIDRFEEALSDELECRIRIRDRKYIESHINDSDTTISAFKTYLEPALAYLREPGAAPIAPRTEAYTDRTLAVFLRQEVEQRQGKSELLQSVADSLILWSLAGTDPDAGIFMTRDEVLGKIETALPSARQFIRGVLDNRLAALRAKSNLEPRQVRYYTNEKKYCLPFETRELVLSENVEDVALMAEFTDALMRRCDAITNENERLLKPAVVRVCSQTLERIFEKQGLQIAQFAHGGEEGDDLYAEVADLAAEVLEQSPDIDDRAVVRKLVLRVLRGVFYDTTSTERQYILKLSRTYVLLLLLKNEPKIVEYFQTLSSKFTLYIGTDFLVRALSEHYLSPKNQTTRNLFEILRAAGSTLILTEKAVEELATHIRGQIFEFQNHYEYVEPHLTLDSVEYIDRILIRSYFYARLAPFSSMKPPAGWRSYIDQFCSFEAIRNETGNEQLARYLINKFGMAYETSQQMEAGINPEEVESLADEILRIKTEAGKMKEKGEILARNDALQVHRIYQRRLVEGEGSPANPFGFKTWWLTQDGSVRRGAAQLVFQNHGHRFMMRPEFLLNFISFAPSRPEVVASFREIFPSVLGIRLSSRLHSESFRKVMEEANKVARVDDARAASMITECTNTLKGDVLKIYENKW